MKLMKTKTTLIIALLMLSLSAAAAFTTVSKAYEIALSDFRAPSTLNGSVTFKECAVCDPLSVRVTPKTQYVINDETVSLKEFRKSIFRIRNRADETIIVLHHLETNTVVSVSVTL